MKAVVLHDVYRYETEPGVVETAHKGDEIEVSDKEFKRGSGSDPAGLAKAGAKSAAQSPDENEKQISNMTGAELDAKAAELGVEDWDDKAKVADKKTTLEAFVAAQSPDENE